MSTTHHYRSNLRDTFFNLFEFLDVGRTTLGHGPYTSFDEATARETLTAVERVCREELAPSWAESDRDPTHMDAQGNIVLPDSLKRAMNAFYDGDWHRYEIPTHLGGFGAPPSLVWGSFEMVVGANANAGYYLFGSFIARVIDRLASDAQKARYLPQMIERRWGGAMVLTEPDAGSDVGAARAKATHVAGDEWHIEGTKRFITNGDYDLAENIVHLVLARPEGAGGGTKGLAMFIVPKYWVEADGTMTERNGWACTKLEKKMGLKSSATCEIVYGGDKPARGLLVGDRHDGIRQMFHVIENARMAVGMKSLSTLSTGYLNALAYTRDRVQGADLPRALDKTSPRVPIIRHADVRRMLMAQKAHAEGLRALALYVAHIQDKVEILGGHGSAEAAQLDALNDLLLPLVKGYSSEKAFELLTLSLQCFGGSGYVQDFPIEQYLRDQKIDTLYEGTTHIQALDLFFRKIARDGGATLQYLQERVAESLTSGELNLPELAHERAALVTAAEDLKSIFMSMLGKATESVHHVGLQGNRILFALAEVVVGWLLLRHAALALKKLPEATGDDRAFYQGKVASARWFARNVLPGVGHARALIEASSLELMEMPDECFG